MSNIQPSPARTGALVAALLLGSVLLLLATLGAVTGVTTHFSSYWNGEADIVTPRIPFADSWADQAKEGGAAYTGVMISSPEALLVPRALQATDAGLTSLIAIVGSLLVVLLAARLLARSGFSRIARWGLAVLGVLIMAKAAVGPQLQVLAVDIAVQELGYAIVDPNGSGMMTESSPELISLGLWDPVWTLSRVDLTFFLVGAVIAVLGFLVADGLRLQRETDGLV